MVMHSQDACLARVKADSLFRAHTELQTAARAALAQVHPELPEACPLFFAAPRGADRSSENVRRAVSRLLWRPVEATGEL
eukprot:1074347-Alexandrium_andersonii.AAC.1